MRIFYIYVILLVYCQEGNSSMREMNLLPEEYLYKKEQNKKRRKFLGIVVIFILSFIIIYFIIIFVNFNIEKKLSSVDSNMQSLAKIEKNQLKISSYQEVITDYKNLLRKLDDKKMDHFTFFKGLEKTLPNGVILNQISYSERNSFYIEGKTTNPNKIADFIANLSKIRGVKNVLLNNINYSTKDNDSISLSSFSISFTYSWKEEKENDFDS